MSFMNLNKTIALLLCIATLSACGSGSDAGTNDKDSSVPTASSRPSGAPGGLDNAQLEAIQTCLKAAGLGDALPTEMPTDMPSERPTDMPTDGAPSGMPGGGAGMAQLQGPEAQDALKACGIELPGPPAGGAP